METTISVFMGIALAAACGFRVFLPFLVVSVAATTGSLPLGESFGWLGTWPAVIVLSAATVAEVLAFYVPWVDNLLDALATPATLVAGTLATASVIVDLPPAAKWAIAAIAGGGVAGIVQGGSVAARGASTVTTGGLGNFAVSTAELVGSIVTSLLALALPVLAFVLVVVLCVFAIRNVARLGFRRRRAARAPE